MQEDLEMLLQLQVIDYDLGELERSKEYIPDMMENLKREMEEIARQFENTRQSLADSRVALKGLELDVNSKQEELKKLQNQMMAIKTNKEYDALVSQIDNVKEAINEGETRLLELIEKIEKLELEISDFEKKAKEIQDQNEKQLTILKEKMDSVGTKVRMKEDERSNITVRIPRPIMSTYERVRKNRGGAAVVPVRKRACGGCYKALSPHVIQEIKRHNQLITCDNCGRILIWQNGVSE
ncbi:MAG: hypothetical protein JSV44_08900 [Candidatus Zixiibacteriota bacterium]|nr:MAG: hypothetical protein JSV44_08900 [candidate division Zixibacteria bacterium]